MDLHGYFDVRLRVDNSSTSHSFGPETNKVEKYENIYMYCTDKILRHQESLSIFSWHYARVKSPV